MGGQGSLWQRTRGLYRLFREGLAINRQLVREQIELLESRSFDRVIFHPKATFPFVWAARFPDRAVVLSPVPWVIHPVPGHAHLGFGWLGRLGGWRISYDLANFGLLQNILPPTKDYRRKYGISSRDVKRAITGTRLLFNVSPALLQPPADWPGHVKCFGFLRSESTAEHPLPLTVEAFMDRHPRFVVITFGSMANEDPAGKTEIVLRALERAGIAAIINEAGGGLREPREYDRERILFTRQLAYDRVFPRASAIVHHGGAGTTQTGLFHGCPTMIVPHIIDQYAWNRLIAERGLGPAGPPVKALDINSLSDRLTELAESEAYHRACEALAEQMRDESYREELDSFLAV